MNLFNKKEVENQVLLDEIHQRPEVKKTFVICEIFEILDWLVNLLFIGMITYCIWKNTFTADFDFEFILTWIYLVLGGNMYLWYALGIAKVAVTAIQKKQRTKLQVLEDEAKEQINKAKEEGTYQQGPLIAKGFRVFRTVRFWTVIAFLVALAVVFCIKVL